jgi:hypothetical protein
MTAAKAGLHTMTEEPGDGELDTIDKGSTNGG